MRDTLFVLILLTFISGIFLFMLTILGGDETVKSEKRVLDDWEKITRNIVHSYFVKDNPQALQLCKDGEEKVRNMEEGYQLEKYNNITKITNVQLYHDYKWSHDGEYLHVNLYCDYDVAFFIPPWIGGRDNLKVHAGTYWMKKYYNPETKRLISLHFE